MSKEGIKKLDKSLVIERWRNASFSHESWELEMIRLQKLFQKYKYNIYILNRV